MRQLLLWNFQLQVDRPILRRGTDDWFPCANYARTTGRSASRVVYLGGRMLVVASALDAFAGQNDGLLPPLIIDGI
ncbi:hypothetical protein ASD32_25815 [Rhizobium sp. Root483D2]|nr:hypothetical protein ASD32_25815 [Rhizobium sp. Root483D2]